MRTNSTQLLRHRTAAGIRPAVREPEPSRLAGEAPKGHRSTAKSKPDREKLAEGFLLQQQLLDARDYAEAILQTVPPLLILDENLRVTTVNESFCNCFKIPSRQAIGVLVYKLGNGQWNIPRLRTLLEQILPRKSSFKDFEVTHNFPAIGKRTMLLSGRQVDHINRILLFFEDITERRNSESALLASETRYRRLFEAARDGILMIDPATRKITDANPFMTELLGYSRATIVGKELWEIGLLKDEKANRIAFRELRKNHFIRYENLPLRTKSGGRHEVEFVSNLYDEHGREVIQCNIRDITIRKQSEEALRDSERRFRALFNLGPIGVYSCDAAGTIVDFNHRAAELWGGIPTKRSVGKFSSSFTLFRPNGTSLPHAQCPMALVLAGKIPLARDVEAIIERPDRSRSTVIVNVIPIKNDLGEITGAINAFYDITERKRDEELVRESEDLFHAIFTHATAGIAQIDQNGRFTLVNKAYGALTARTPAELLNLRMQDITHVEDLPDYLDQLAKLKKNGVSFVSEKRYVRPDSEIVWVRSSVSCVNYPSGKAKYFLTVAQDFSETKRSELALLSAKNELSELAAHLEQIVQERTGQLRETVSDLQGFSYSVSHDMRAPLRAMQGYAECLISEYSSHLDERAVGYLNQIMRSSVRLDNLIQDVLSYTNILHNSLPMGRVEMDRLVRDIVESFPNGHLLKPHIQINGVLPDVHGNSALLTQCVSNLLSNGTKFVAFGTTPHLEIWAEPRDLSLVRIWFKDNGLGIAPENYERIFRMFERIYPNSEYEGTGIGLTIVRKAVERMGAQVGLESEPGLGSSFWIELKKG